MRFAMVYWVAIAAVAGAQQHPLAYYQADPCLRRDAASRSLHCAANPSAEESEILRKTLAEPQFVGNLEQFQIYDVEYQRVRAADEKVRSVLVGKSKNQLVELLTGEMPTLGSFRPTEVVKSGHQQMVVKVKSDDGGHYHIVSETYFVLLGSKFVMLDFAPVINAAAKAVPKGFFTYQPATQFDLATMTFRIGTEREGLDIGPKVGCCEGVIEVPFRINVSKVSKVVPGLARFHLPSEASPLWTRRLHTPRGDWADAMPSRSIRYFQQHPCLRRNAEDDIKSILQCTREPTELQRLRQARSKLRTIGKIGENTVYELDYLEAGYDSPSKVRSVLVGVSLEELYEIHVQDSTYGGESFPVKIVRAGPDQLLIRTNWSDGGMYVYVYQRFYSVDAEGGAQLLDFTPVFDAVAKACPKEEVFYQPTVDYGIGSRRLRVQTAKRINATRKTGCCEGTVEVPYQIKDGQVIAGKGVYFRRVN